MVDELTEAVIGAAIEVHRILGPGLLEAVYEEALCIELSLRNVSYERQKELDVHYKGSIIKGLRIDMLIEGQLVIELKAVAHLPQIVTAQTLSYLKATSLKRALLINFVKLALLMELKGYPYRDSQLVTHGRY